MDDFFLFAAVGFVAQLVDGSLGMGYGVVSSSVLMALGVPPASVSAAVHASKMFTGAASAASHTANKNVDFSLLKTLALGGALGGVLGTFVVTGIEARVVKPFVIGWLALMGLVILWRAAKTRPASVKPLHRPLPLGVVGGFLDAMGGGGWGPTVTGTLIGGGSEARYAIGTSNTAEFFVALTVSVAFVVALATGHWRETNGMAEYAWAVGGLIVGGLVAAPPAGFLTRRLPTRGLTWMVGLLVLCLASYEAFRMLR